MIACASWAYMCLLITMNTPVHSGVIYLFPAAFSDWHPVHDCVLSVSGDRHIKFSIAQTVEVNRRLLAHAFGNRKLECFVITGKIEGKRSRGHQSIFTR